MCGACFMQGRHKPEHKCFPRRRPPKQQIYSTGSFSLHKKAVDVEECSNQLYADRGYARNAFSGTAKRDDGFPPRLRRTRPLSAVQSTRQHQAHSTMTRPCDRYSTHQKYGETSHSRPNTGTKGRAKGYFKTDISLSLKASKSSPR